MSQEEVRELTGTDKLVIGTNETLKLLKQDSLAKVYLASNAPGETKDDVERYATMSGVDVEELDATNEDLGVLCRKPFKVAVAAKKE
jgi:large subunit ribosomal protein L30e